MTITVCTHCKVEPCTCAWRLNMAPDADIRLVIRASAEHQAECKHPLVDAVANQCTECEKVLGPSMPEQLSELRKRLETLERKVDGT